MRTLLLTPNKRGRLPYNQWLWLNDLVTNILKGLDIWIRARVACDYTKGTTILHLERIATSQNEEPATLDIIRIDTNRFVIPNVTTEQGGGLPGIPIWIEATPESFIISRDLERLFQAVLERDVDTEDRADIIQAFSKEGLPRAS